MKKYYNRLIEQKIKNELNINKAVIVSGPKYCGKSTTCMKYKNSSTKLNKKQTITMANIDPRGILNGEYPRLIDEWQIVPEILNEVNKINIGKYILCNSSTPIDKTKIITLNNNISCLKMKTMSLYESNDSNGLISLGDLFENNNLEIIKQINNISLEDIAYLICRGGWPISIQEDKELGLEITRNHYDSLFVFEDNENEKFRNKKPEVFKMILRSYSKFVSTPASALSIINDICNTNNRTMDRKTYDSYIEALTDLFIIDELNAWEPDIKAKNSIRTTVKRHFTDISIACRSLNLNPTDLLNDLNLLSIFFKDLVVRDLSIYIDCLNGYIKHYKEKNGISCDVILQLPNNEWAPIEIKLGGEKLINEGVNSLISLKNKIKNTGKEKDPSFMAVITATGNAYQRQEDGIYVIPINYLKY